MTEPLADEALEKFDVDWSVITDVTKNPTRSESST